MCVISVFAFSKNFIAEKGGQFKGGEIWAWPPQTSYYLVLSALKFPHFVCTLKKNVAMPDYNNK